MAVSTYLYLDGGIKLFVWIGMVRVSGLVSSSERNLIVVLYSMRINVNFESCFEIVSYE